MNHCNDNKLKKKRIVQKYFLAQKAKQKQNPSSKAAHHEGESIKRKTVVKIELPRTATKSFIPDKPKKVILRIPGTKRKRTREIFCKLSACRNKRKERRSIHIRNCSNRLEACREAIARKRFIRRTSRKAQRCSTRMTQNSKASKTRGTIKKRRPLKRTYIVRRRVKRMQSSDIKSFTKGVSTRIAKKHRRKLRKDFWSCFNPRFVPIVTRGMSRSYNSWKKNMGVNNSDLHNISFAAALFNSGNPKKACPETEMVESQKMTNQPRSSYNPANCLSNNQSYNTHRYLPTMRQGESLEVSPAMPSSSIPLRNLNQVACFNFEKSRSDQSANLFTSSPALYAGKGPFGTAGLQENTNVKQKFYRESSCSRVKSSDKTMKIRRKSYSATRVVTDFDSSKKESVFAIETRTWDEATVITQDENVTSDLMQKLSARNNNRISEDSNNDCVKLESHSKKGIDSVMHPAAVLNNIVEPQKNPLSFTENSTKLDENITVKVDEKCRLLLEEIKKFFTFYQSKYEDAKLEDLPYFLKLLSDKKNRLPEGSDDFESNFRNETEVISADKNNEENTRMNPEHVFTPVRGKLEQEGDEHILDCEKLKLFHDKLQDSQPVERNPIDTESGLCETPPLTFPNLLLNDQLCNLEVNANKKCIQLKSFRRKPANQDRKSEAFSVQSAEVSHFIENNLDKAHNKALSMPVLTTYTHQTSNKLVENEYNNYLCNNSDVPKFQDQELWRNIYETNDTSNYSLSFASTQQSEETRRISPSNSKFWELFNPKTSASVSISDESFDSIASEETNTSSLSSNQDEKSFESISGMCKTFVMENVAPKSDDGNTKYFRSYKNKCTSSIDVLSRTLKTNLSMTECADENQKIKNPGFMLSARAGTRDAIIPMGDNSHKDCLHLNMSGSCEKNEENNEYNYAQLNSNKLGGKPHLPERLKSKKVNYYLNDKQNFPDRSSSAETSENSGLYKFSDPTYNYIRSSDYGDINSYCSTSTVEEFSMDSNSFPKWCHDCDTSYCNTTDSFLSSHSSQNLILLSKSAPESVSGSYSSEGIEMAVRQDECSNNLSNTNLSETSLNFSVDSLSSQNSPSDSCMVISSCSEDENDGNSNDEPPLKYGEARIPMTSFDFKKEAISSSENGGNFDHGTVKTSEQSIMSQEVSNNVTNENSGKSESKFKLKRVPSRSKMKKKKFENGCLYWLKQKRLKNVNQRKSIKYIPINISKRKNCDCRSLKIKFVMSSKVPKAQSGDQRENNLKSSANLRSHSIYNQQQGDSDSQSVSDVYSSICSQDVKRLLLEQLSTNEVLAQIGLRVCAYETPVELIVSPHRKNKKGAYHKILTFCGYD
ncbi:hypothetical protein NPIL_690952 [Nephila pilipes]|uniref:Uncharacterized protein n=1 Tax=Nephila pilipes TaxID=299642 RepID=A0A8X6P9I3_NEPPI|nr:hypothetical protein NPIL_690952 [Nephila pilipes]